MRCKSVKNKLPLYVSADLSHRAKEKIEAHLRSCPDCRLELKSLEEALRRIKEADLAESQKIASWDEESWPGIREEIGRTKVNRLAQPGLTYRRQKRYALGLATAAGIFLIGILMYLVINRAAEKPPITNAANQDVVMPEIETQPARTKAEVNQLQKEAGVQTKPAGLSSRESKTAASDLSYRKTSEQLEERIEMAFILPESGIQVIWILDRNFNLEGEKK